MAPGPGPTGHLSTTPPVLRSSCTTSPARYRLTQRLLPWVTIEVGLPSSFDDQRTRRLGKLTAKTIPPALSTTYASLPSGEIDPASGSWPSSARHPYAP